MKQRLRKLGAKRIILIEAPGLSTRSQRRSLIIRDMSAGLKHYILDEIFCISDLTLCRPDSGDIEQVQ